MSRNPKLGANHVSVGIAVLAGVVVLLATPPAVVSGAAEPCCFANDRYEGICTVIPAEGETCESILEYLNSPMSVGKSYCRRTSIRGGWAQVDCQTGRSVVQQGAAGSKPAAGSSAPAPAERSAREAGAGAR